MPDIYSDFHEIPLANRIVEDLIMQWLDISTSSALATISDLNEYEKGFRAGVIQMRYLHLDNYPYILIPSILENLERADLMIRKE